MLSLISIRTVAKVSMGTSIALHLPTGSVKLPPGYNKPSAFSLYVQENRQSGKNAAETVKVISKIWRKLSDSDKKPYREKALQISEERRALFDSLTEMQRFTLRDEHAAEKERQLRRLRRKFLHEHYVKTNRPKRPGNAYATFVAERFHDDQLASMSNSERFAHVSREWAELSGDEKMKYKAMSDEKHKAYHDQLDAWRSEQSDDVFPESVASKELLKRIKKLQIKHGK